MFIIREEGQGLVEYAMILVLIAVAIAIVLGLLGVQLGELYSRIVDAFPV